MLEAELQDVGVAVLQPFERLLEAVMKPLEPAGLLPASGCDGARPPSAKGT